MTQFPPRSNKGTEVQISMWLKDDQAPINKYIDFLAKCQAIVNFFPIALPG
jgi:hypothetical protein